MIVSVIIFFLKFKLTKINVNVKQLVIFFSIWCKNHMTNTNKFVIEKSHMMRFVKMNYLFFDQKNCCKYIIAHSINSKIMISGTQLTKGLKRCNTCKLCLVIFYTKNYNFVLFCTIHRNNYTHVHSRQSFVHFVRHLYNVIIFDHKYLYIIVMILA